MKYSHSWIFGCHCAPINERYRLSERIYNRSGEKYKLINYIEARYFRSGRKWCKNHIIHCKKCKPIKEIKHMFPEEMLFCSGVTMT